MKLKVNSVYLRGFDDPAMVKDWEKWQMNGGIGREPATPARMESVVASLVSINDKNERVYGEAFHCEMPLADLPAGATLGTVLDVRFTPDPHGIPYPAGLCAITDPADDPRISRLGQERPFKGEECLAPDAFNIYALPRNLEMGNEFVKAMQSYPEFRAFVKVILIEVERADSV